MVDQKNGQKHVQSHDHTEQSHVGIGQQQATDTAQTDDADEALQAFIAARDRDPDEC